MIRVWINKELSKAERNRCWKAFMSGGSTHSRMSLTLPQIINECEKKGQPYILKAQPGVGYYIEPLDLSERWDL